MSSILSLLVPSAAATPQSEDSKGSALLGANALLPTAQAPGVKELFSQLLNGTNVTGGVADGKNITALQSTGKAALPDAQQQVVNALADTTKNDAQVLSYAFQPFQLTAEQIATVQQTQVAAPVVQPSGAIQYTAQAFPLVQLQQQMKDAAFKQAESVSQNISSVAAYAQAHAQGTKDVQATDYADLIEQWSMEGGQGMFPGHADPHARIVKTGDSFSILSGEADSNSIIDYSLHGGLYSDTAASGQQSVPGVAIPVATVLPSTVPLIPVTTDVANAIVDDALQAGSPLMTSLQTDAADIAVDDTPDGLFTAPDDMTESGARDLLLPQAVKAPSMGASDLLSQQTKTDIAPSIPVTGATNVDVTQTTPTLPVGLSVIQPSSAASVEGDGVTIQTVTPAQVHDQVSVRIRQAIDGGTDEISIKLNPPELGRIDVKMSIGQDGKTHLVFNVDQRDTLELLQRDTRGLERSLQETGLKTDNASMQFNLRQDQQGRQFGQNEQDPAFTPFYNEGDEYGTKDALVKSTITETTYQMSVTNGLDLKV